MVVFISIVLIDSYISYDKLVSVNGVLRECNEIKEEFKKAKNAMEYTV